jgi:pyrophosphatase PpaX
MTSRALDTFLFDLDGTLIDSIELIRRSFRHTLLVHRGWEPPEDEWLTGLGTPLPAQFAHYTDEAREIEAMIATYRRFNAEHHDALVHVYPGAIEAVRDLKRRGARTGVVTSKLRAGALRGLAHCGYGDELFDLVIAMDDVERHKPEPDPVLAALERLRSDASSSIYIGDSPHDLASGRAAGVRTAAVLWGPFPRAWLASASPDLWLEHPRDIAKLLR